MKHFLINEDMAVLSNEHEIFWWNEYGTFLNN